MARITILRKYPDGDLIQVSVKVGDSYPDCMAEARATAHRAFADAVGVVLADVTDEGEQVAKPQHRTPEYVAAYKAIKRAQAAGQVLVCVEPVCKRGDRRILPTMRASVSHDTTGRVILGPSHLKCNLSEAATRGNKMRARKRVRYAW